MVAGHISPTLTDQQAPVSVIDTAINAVTATIPAGFGVVDVTADGTRVYITQDIGAVSVINIATTR
jgi:YVTN family beta-propeller protein